MKNITKIAARSAKLLTKAKGSGGSALPGLVIEKLEPDFLSRTLANLPHGVAVVSGTNGKTTSTKTVVELLTTAGLRVFTNPTGSNFTRGIASAVFCEIEKSGSFHFDIAVLELDEAHAVHFVNKVAPRYFLLLNVLPDQLDRFGDVNTTAGFLKTVAKETTNGVVLNANDSLLNKVRSGDKVVHFFGYDSNLTKLFSPDNERPSSDNKPINPDVVLKKISGKKVVFNIGETTLQLSGAHNALNSAGALALVKVILGREFNAKKMLRALSNVKPAFGRGEVISVNGKPVELVLVKNSAGCRMSLAAQNNEQTATMIAINDTPSDGRDISWLWDVDFTALKNVACVSGVRAYDMALRLQHDNIAVGSIDTNLRRSLSRFISDNSSSNFQIYCTYSAMLKLRKYLGLVAQVEKAL
ncbi:MurT ligase domain-containing protein [Candidatus Saccharibacteria bacterium]|nr:MurT ligase domain-containing protein [Candidatus Saccharibacteria bacterium]